MLKISNDILRFLFVPGIFLFAFLFRVIFAGNFPLGFDQVQILEQAHAILQGDLTLIGPRTGPASMFTGPLIYYLAAPFIWAFGDILSVVLVPLTLSILTGIVLWWSVRRYVGQTAAFLATTLWAFSPFLVSMDRVLWNPNFTLMAATLLFFPLVAAPSSAPKNNKLLSADTLALFAGSFLAYQAHFSGLLLIGLALVTLLALSKTRHLALQKAGIILIGFLASISSIIVFDLRNDFLNARGLIALFSSTDNMSLFTLLKDFAANGYILAETAGKIFLFANSTNTIVITGVIILFAGLLYVKNDPMKIAYSWLSAIAFIYAWYRGEKPEYYFLIALPALLFIISHLLTRLHKQALFVILGLFLASATITNLTLPKQPNGLTLKNLQAVIKYLQTQQPLQQIVYDMPYGSHYGLEYLAHSLETADTGAIIHISYPNDLAFKGVAKIANIGVWTDQRQPQENTLMQKGYTVTTSQDTLLLHNLYPHASADGLDVYSIVRDGVTVGALWVAQDRLEEPTWLTTCHELKRNKNTEWTPLPTGEYLKYTSEHCSLLQSTTNTPLSVDEVRVQ